MNKIKIKIISDGTSIGTHVHAGGTEITGITGIEILPIEPGGVVMARITFQMPKLDIVAELKEESNS